MPSEWMPINPCDGCPNNPNNENPNGCMHRSECPPFGKQQAILADRKVVIEWLDEHFSVHRMKDDDAFSDGDYMILPMKDWKEFKGE
jgi:hypothetical protein